MLTDPKNTAKGNLRRLIASTVFLESAVALERNQTSVFALHLDSRSVYFDLSVRPAANSPKGKRYAY